MHRAPRTLMTAVILVLVSSHCAAQLIICGDPNQDQRINVLDGFMIARADAGLITLSPTETAQGDTTSNGAADITDALLILQFTVRLIDDLDCMGFGSEGCESPALAIPDLTTVNDTTAVVSSVVISGNFEVDIDLDHGDIRDLTVTIIHPDTTAVILHNRTGSPAAGGIRGTYPTTLTPAQSLSAFDGKPMNGTWTLRINDGAFGDVGTLNTWCVRGGLVPRPVSNQTYSLVTASRLGNNLIHYPYARLTGGGIPENTIQFSANEWSTGDNRVNESGGGDDQIVGLIPGGSWSTTLSPVQAIIDPVTGFLVAGDITGKGFVDYTNPTFGNARWDVASVPPDWIP